jgi:hypothetical protein
MLIYGLSSLVFIVPTIKAFSCKNWLWKILNVCVVGASFLCNVYQYQEPYLSFDYFCIFLICLTCIDDKRFNIPLIKAFAFEYSVNHSMSITKNTAFVLSNIKAITRTYEKAPNYFTIIIASSMMSWVVYYIRMYSEEIMVQILLTWVFHISCATTLYVSSITI